MSAPQHTPGPWQWARSGMLTGAGESKIVLSRSAALRSMEGHERLANARLIAAAPTYDALLREARKELRLLNVREDGSQAPNTPAASLLLRIDAALAKVTP